jgi:hypothetical protein
MKVIGDATGTNPSMYSLPTATGRGTYFRELSSTAILTQMKYSYGGVSDFILGLFKQ